MIKYLKNLIAFPDFLLNRFTIFYRMVSYSSFPTINGRVSIRGNGKLILGNNVTINSLYSINPVGIAYKTSFHITPNAIVEIGNNVGISNSLFFSRAKITLQDNVLIGGGCQFLDNDFHSLGYKERVLEGDNNVKSAPILVKEGAFIGASCIILKGVTVGSRSIVAAGSVVSKSIPDNEIWGGNPASFIKKSK